MTTPKINNEMAALAQRALSSVFRKALEAALTPPDPTVARVPKTFNVKH